MCKIHIKKSLLFLSTFAILAGLIYFGYYSNVYNPVDPGNAENISFQIKKGQSVKEIAHDLEAIKLIDSNLAFYLYVKFHGLGQKIIAGRFLLSQNMTVPQILATISDASQAEFIITIQEGLTVKDIDQKLVDLSLIEPDAFSQAVMDFNGWEYYAFLDRATLEQLELPLEGYLYPDTYFLDPLGFQPHDLIYLALDNFEKKIADLSPKTRTGYNFHETLTMASIIENEVFGLQDRKTVSGILWKRHENGWPLGADATLLYVTADRKINATDLETDSPYNTRKFKGLPPGPISNPSLESLKAAISPQSGDYWFYLTTPDTGKVIYAKTNEEHNANRAKYL